MLFCSIHQTFLRNSIPEFPIGLRSKDRVRLWNQDAARLLVW